MAQIIQGMTAAKQAREVQTDDNGRMIISAVGISATDKSGTITLANTSQLVAAANTSRKAFWLQNISDVDMWVQLGKAAVVGEGFFVAANGGTLQFESIVIPTNAIYVICASAGEAFSAYEG